MKFKWNFEGMQNLLLRIALLVLAAASIVTAIVDVPAAWQTPFVLVALFLIITMLDPVKEIDAGVKGLVKSFSAPTRTYPNSQSLYHDLGNEVRAAIHGVDLTHIRDNPPSDLGAEGVQYNDIVEAWLRQNSSHSARRMISVRSNSMMAWAIHLQQVTRELPNYHVRVVDWSIDAPALNMAIIDRRSVFLTMTEDVFERTKGFNIENRTTADYFTGYYSNLWSCAIDLDEYLAREVSG